MLHTRSKRVPVEGYGPAASTRSGGLADFLLDLLESAESYGAHIQQAERDGDFELAAFLRGLRRQDLSRMQEAVRLIRRPRDGSWEEGEVGA